VNYKRKSRRQLLLLMRSRTPPISSEFGGGEFEPPKPPLRYATVTTWVRRTERQAPCYIQWTSSICLSGRLTTPPALHFWHYSSEVGNTNFGESDKWFRSIRVTDTPNDPASAECCFETILWHANLQSYSKCTRNFCSMYRPIQWVKKYLQSKWWLLNKLVSCNKHGYMFRLHIKLSLDNSNIHT